MHKQRACDKSSAGPAGGGRRLALFFPELELMGSSSEDSQEARAACHNLTVIDVYFPFVCFNYILYFPLGERRGELSLGDNGKRG